MPVRVYKVKGGYRVRTPSGIKAKRTSKKKAEAQARLLRALDNKEGKMARKKYYYRKVKGKKIRCKIPRKHQGVVKSRKSRKKGYNIYDF